ncbi:MAG: hypothetical protein ACK45U_06840, partial [bacterium]
LPFALPSIISNLIFKKEKEYINGTHIVIGLLLFIFSYFIYAIVLYMIMQNILSVIISLAIIALCGIMAYHYKRRFIEFIKAISFEIASNKLKIYWFKQSDVLITEFKQWLSN